MLVRTVAVVALMAWLLPVAAAAGAVQVNTTADAKDFNTADPFCDSDSGTAGEQCTLRAAVEQTNQQPGADEVLLPAGTYTLLSASFGELEVSDDLTILGAGAASTTIRQEVSGRIFKVEDRFDLRDATVRAGVLAAEGGGILNEGILRLERVVVANNEAFASNGGGIAAPLGAVATTIVDSTIGSTGPGMPANRAGLNGGGLYVDGGVLTISGSRILGNSANGANPNGVGGGFRVLGDATVRGTTIANNRGDRGAGIFATGTPALLTLEDSTVEGNIADVQAGGVALYSTFRITNSTVTGNRAEANTGGIYVSADGKIAASTVSGNTAPFAAGLNVVSTPDPDRPLDPVSQPRRRQLPAQRQRAESGGGRFAGLQRRVGRDLPARRPGRPLQHRPSARRARRQRRSHPDSLPLPGSPALDLVPLDACLSAVGTPLGADQRGLPRPSGPLCNAGAQRSRCLRRRRSPRPRRLRSPPVPPTASASPACDASRSAASRGSSSVSPGRAAWSSSARRSARRSAAPSGPAGSHCRSGRAVSPAGSSSGSASSSSSSRSATCRAAPPPGSGPAA